MITQLAARHRRLHMAAGCTSTAASENRGMRQTSQGSFSAVSKRSFASKYAFESSQLDLHDALLCTALKSQFFSQKLAKKFVNFCKIINFLINFATVDKNLAIVFFFLKTERPRVGGASPGRSFLEKV